jgi:hypothetical protein
MAEGIQLLDLPQAAIGEIEGGNFAYMVTPDGQPFKVEISQLVAKMQQDAGCGCVQTARLFIPSAEVLTLNTTPKAFGLNVPAGYAVQPLSWHMQSTFNSVAYATNTTLLLRAVTGGPVTNLGFMISVLAFVDNTFTANGLSIGGSANANCLIDGADLEVFVGTGDPTAGDSDITLYLTYMLIEL